MILMVNIKDRYLIFCMVNFLGQCLSLVRMYKKVLQKHYKLILLLMNTGRKLMRHLKMLLEMTQRKRKNFRSDSKTLMELILLLKIWRIMHLVSKKHMQIFQMPVILLTRCRQAICQLLHS